MNRREFFGASIGLIPLKALGNDVVEGVCKRGKPSEHCRYFATDDSDGTPNCLKLTPFRQEIDEEVELFLREVAYDETNLPIGDNCSGCAPPLSALLN